MLELLVVLAAVALVGGIVVAVFAIAVAMVKVVFHIVLLPLKLILFPIVAIFVIVKVAVLVVFPLLVPRSSPGSRGSSCSSDHSDRSSSSEALRSGLVWTLTPVAAGLPDGGTALMVMGPPSCLTKRSKVEPHSKLEASSSPSPFTMVSLAPYVPAQAPETR